MASTSKDNSSNRTWAAPARACRWLGGLGMALLVVLLGYNIFLSFRSTDAGACPDMSLRNVTVTNTDPQTVRIIGIEPADLQLNRALCIEVENVVSPTKQSALVANLVVAANTAKQTAAASRNPANPANTGPPEIVSTLAEATQTKANADLATAKAAFDDAHKPRVMALYLNGKVTPLTATARAVPDPQVLTFQMDAPEDANSADAAYWRALLAEPTHFGKIAVRIGIAEQGTPAPLVNVQTINSPGPKPLTFVAYTPLISYAADVAVLGVGLLFFGWAYDTTLLRSSRDRNSPYSLALVQMAVWLILTTMGFLYIWVVTGQYLNVFTSGLFVLIGISGATATAAQVIDRNVPTPQSRGFFQDIAGAWEGGEVQLQRVQIIAWTIILVLIFLANLVRKLTLTSFDTNLLVLTGIANGVYVSLKPQETKPAQPQQAAASPPPSSSPSPPPSPPPPSPPSPPTSPPSSPPPALTKP